MWIILCGQLLPVGLSPHHKLTRELKQCKMISHPQCINTALLKTISTHGSGKWQHNFQTQCKNFTKFPMKKLENTLHHPLIGLIYSYFKDIKQKMWKWHILECMSTVHGHAFCMVFTAVVASCERFWFVTFVTGNQFFQLLSRLQPDIQGLSKGVKLNVRCCVLEKGLNNMLVWLLINRVNRRLKLRN